MLLLLCVGSLTKAAHDELAGSSTPKPLDPKNCSIDQLASSYGLDSDLRRLLVTREDEDVSHTEQLKNFLRAPECFETMTRLNYKDSLMVTLDLISSDTSTTTGADLEDLSKLLDAFKQGR